jgi:branched-chain amino acid transport system permease protein
VAYLTQQVLNGVVVGSVIALVAVGYTLVYGITRHIQFAYGELLTIGAYMTGLAYIVLSLAGMDSMAGVVGLGLPLVMGAAALNGYAIERVVFRRIGQANPQAALIAAVGLSIFLQEFVRLSQGARGRWMPSLLPGKFELFTSGGFDVSVTYTQVVIVILATLVSLGQGWILGSTVRGRCYRACADDARMAALLGVNVVGVVAMTYACGAALAAMAGAAMILHYGLASSQMGVLFGFKALTAALLGGIGSFAGALVGGLLIGLFEALWAAYLGGAWRDAAVFAVLVVVLVYRPEGLFGHADPLTSGGSGGAPGSVLRTHPTDSSRA